MGKIRPSFPMDRDWKINLPNRNKFSPTTHKSEIFFTTCEHLIAPKWSILVSQPTKGKKNFTNYNQMLLFFGTTSQMVESIGEGIKQLKKKVQRM